MFRSSGQSFFEKKTALALEVSDWGPNEFGTRHRKKGGEADGRHFETSRFCDEVLKRKTSRNIPFVFCTCNKGVERKDLLGTRARASVRSNLNKT
jgi:hypothetical protein